MNGIAKFQRPPTATQRNSFASSPCRLSRPPPMVSSVEGGSEQVVKYVEKRARALNELSDSVSDKLLRLTPTPVQRTTTNERASEVEFQNRGEESRLRSSARSSVRPYIAHIPLTHADDDGVEDEGGREGIRGVLNGRTDARTRREELPTDRLRLYDEHEPISCGAAAAAWHVLAPSCCACSQFISYTL